MGGNFRGWMACRNPALAGINCNSVFYRDSERLLYSRNPALAGINCNSPSLQRLLVGATLGRNPALAGINCNGFREMRKSCTENTVAIPL